ncbi:polyglutamine-binding protein 1 [Coccinella septempunctata]|uniref:polyglutamine-binding protein 1 n=1 Tax=Coccinella septempunctata TaxID=41139 RepID=UPI001D098160|nr:polyglutamine-binding protein 1 [Coccinella septempunctata]
MPLPPALLAKLSKRGIVAPPSKTPAKTTKKDDYKGYVYCPNKVNMFHICSVFCETNWRGHPTPEPTYARSMQKLLFKYPLPSNWIEVFDKGVGRYYYWNIENDLVSWLPPKHPKAKITKCAAKLREQYLTAKKSDTKEKESDDTNDSDEKEFKKPSPRVVSRRDSEDKSRKDDKHSSKRPRKDNVLDPMDPASYSDIAPGTWSDGLENNKTHADNTASGVLYQQRPYPSPGEVLSSNKEKQSKKH